MSSRTRPAPAERRGEGRSRIVEEATELFLARGYADVSMQNIADAAGVTKATLYHHFTGKESLFAEVARSQVNQFWEGIIRYAERGNSLRESLTSIARFLGDESPRLVFWRLIDDMQRYLSPETLRVIFTEHPDPHDALRQLFERAIESGEMRPLDTEVVARIFEGMIMGINTEGHSRRELRPEEAEQLVDVLLRGVATP